jgi:hypothetical protein
MPGDPLLAIGMSGDSSKLEEFDSTAVMAEWARIWSRLVTAELVHEAPVGQGDDAGALRDSIGEPAIDTGAGRVSMTWTSDVPYAGFVVEGTQPHPIYPVNVRALHWDSIFAAHVNHPGTKPNPFPERAIDRLLPEMTSSLGELFKEI